MAWKQSSHYGDSRDEKSDLTASIGRKRVTKINKIPLEVFLKKPLVIWKMW